MICLKDGKPKTLDDTHNKYIDKFSNEQNVVIPLLHEKRDEIIAEINNSTDLPIETVLDLKEQLVSVNKQVDELNGKRSEYYMKNSKHIFEYFETKQNISLNAPNTNEAPKSSKMSSIINKFFKVSEDEAEIVTPKSSDIERSVVCKYLTQVDETFLDTDSFIKPDDVCQSCHKGELVSNEEDGMLICNHCSGCIKYLSDTEKPSYKDPPKEVSTYAYKKLNHFKEVVSQFQAKQTTTLAPEIIANIKRQIVKERLVQDQLTYYKMKEMFKKLGYSYIYDHINYVKKMLGIPPPIMSVALEEQLYNLFNELQTPYFKFCPPERINFSNYYFILYKLCELLGEIQYLKEIPMLKDRNKIIEQSEIWRKMCAFLNWRYIPTV